MRTRFGDAFEAASAFIVDDPDEMQHRVTWLAQTINRSALSTYGVQPNMWLIAHLAEAGEISLRDDDEAGKQHLIDWGWKSLSKYSGTDTRTLEGIKMRAYRAAQEIGDMKQTERQ